jgi:ABC-type sugar transport system ATPase subunit
MEAHFYGAREIGKSFSGARVLTGVDFEIETGQIHALLGENGSGKSTLIRLLGGVHRPSEGTVVVDREPASVASPGAAARLGLGIVHQDLNLFPDLDIATNIAMTAGAPIRGVTRTVDRRRLNRRADEVLERLGLRVDPRLLLRELSLAEWKLIEVARTLTTDARFLILDEPTALLDRRDSRTVLATVKRLRDDGFGIALVTHRLDEALEVADRFTVLRDGRVAATPAAPEADAPTLVRHIVGDAGERGERAEVADFAGAAEVAMELRAVELAPGAAPFDLTLRRGEIVGLTGLVGAGALELARRIAGRDPLVGTALIEGEEARLRSPRDAIAHGIGYIPEDRKEAGIVDCLSVEENLCLASLPAVTPRGFLRRNLMRRQAGRYAGELAIKARSLGDPISSLSGGNQQKVQIGKWLSSGPRILVVESPTHGVDVGAKAEIHRLLREFAAGGGVVVVASTDIPDVLAIADRVAVFRDGTLASTVTGAKSSHRDLLLSGAQDAKVDEIEELLEV